MRSKLCVMACVFLACSARLSAIEVSGKQVEERVERVMKSLDWQPSLEAAKQKAEKESKLIFWLQLVGELNGGL